MKVIVNDQELDVADTMTVNGLLDSLGYPERGIAVAVNSTLVACSNWDVVLSEGSRVEVVTAVQGG